MHEPKGRAAAGLYLVRNAEARTPQSMQHRLLLGTSYEFQRAVDRARSEPMSASEAAARGAYLAVIEAVAADSERVTLLTIDRIKRLEQAWVISKGVDSVIRG
jgi:hypothetical protein